MAGELEQVMFGGESFGALGTGTTGFCSFHNAPSQTWGAATDPVDSGTGTYKSSIFTCAGTITKFRVHCHEAVTALKPITFTIFKNNASTSITCTITNPALDGSDLVNSLAVVAGDVLSIKYTKAAGGNNIIVSATATFVSNNAFDSNHCGNVTGDFVGDNFDDDVAYTLDGVVDDETTCFGSLVGGSTPSSTENRFIVCPTSGTIKNFFINIGQTPDAGKSYAFTVRKNGVDTTVVATIADTNLSASDLTHSFSVVAGDLLSWKCVPTGLPNGDAFNTTIVNIGFTFQSDVAGQYPIFQTTAKWTTSHGFAQSTTTDRFLGAYDMKEYLAVTVITGSQIVKSQLFNACTIKKIYVRLSTAPGSGNSRGYTLYKNNAATALVLTISELNTTGSTETDVSFTNSDLGWTREVLTSIPDNSWESISYLVQDTAIHTDPIDGTISGNYCPYVSQGQVRKMVTNVTGLTHLNGEEVSVQADGLPENSQTYEVSGGTLTPALPGYRAVVHVGLPYTGRIKLLPASDGSPKGTGQTKMRRIYSVVARVFRSLGFKIGLDEDHLDPMVLSDPVLPLLTADLEKTPKVKWDKRAQLTIIQDLPVPLMIMMVLLQSEVEVGG